MMPTTTRQSNDENSRKINELATKKDIDQLKDLLMNLQEKIVQQHSEIVKLTEKTTLQDDKISKLEDKIEVLSAGLTKALKKGDDVEQFSRSYCLRIKGIKCEKDELSTKCVEKVVEVCENLNVGISKDDIDRAHPVGKNRDTMIVKFYSFSKRTLLYRARKRNNKIKIFLDITKKRLDTLNEARKNIQKNSTTDFVFADVNCNLVAKLKSGSFKFFNDIDSFLKIGNVENV